MAICQWQQCVQLITLPTAPRWYRFYWLRHPVAITLQLVLTYASFSWRHFLEDKGDAPWVYFSLHQHDLHNIQMHKPIAYTLDYLPITTRFSSPFPFFIFWSYSEITSTCFENKKRKEERKRERINWFHRKVYNYIYYIYVDTWYFDLGVRLAGTIICLLDGRWAFKECWESKQVGEGLRAGLLTGLR